MERRRDMARDESDRCERIVYDVNSASFGH
jgi:hypothetical protein